MPAVLAILAVSSSSAAELIAIVGALLGVGVVIALLRSSRAGPPRARLTFELRVGTLASAAEAHRYEHVFLTYAREDHQRVLEAVHVVRALGMSFFQDVLSIDPGERWERRLYEELDTCDALLLFWSVAAKRSEWVRKEVGYALQRNGGEDDVAPAIRPVFIEGPPVEAPWDELSKLQWDDPLLHFRV